MILARIVHERARWKSSIHRLVQKATVPFQHTEYNGIRKVIMHLCDVTKLNTTRTV